MPELPEVEIFKRFIDQHALNKAIEAVHVFQPKILDSADPQNFKQTLTDHCFSETLRRGKHLFVQIQALQQSRSQLPLPWLFFHFGMSGYLSYGNQGQTMGNAYNDSTLKHEHIRIRFDFSDGSHLAFHEQRMFGKAGLIADPQDYIAAKNLGPDALSIDEATFLTRLKARKGTIKPVLMDQSMVAGIGNVYADEILFQCRIHPEARISALTTKQIQHLFQQTEAVLQNTVAVGADRNQLPKAYFLHQRHPKGKCSRDNTPFEIKQVGGRTTYFCPKCQH